MARIIIIDDNDELRGMVRLFLTDAGHQVDDASNGVEGMKLFRKQPADLLIVDVLMPEKGGLETIQELRKDFPKAKVIAISGGFKVRADEDSPFAQLYEVQKTLAKPFSPTELLKAVDEVLKS